MSERRVTIVASELLGRAGTGGAGTADSLLAIALARHGHRVRLLIASGRDIGTLNADWQTRYDAAGVRIDLLDVAIVNDWRGLGYAALRARQTAIALTETAFIVHCHGPGRVLTEFAQKVPDTVERFAEDVTERCSLELADAVVSP